MKNLITTAIRLNDITKDVAWINSEYIKMFSFDSEDLDMINDNDREHCVYLLTLLESLIDEIKFITETTNVNNVKIKKLSKLVNNLSKKLLKLIPDKYKGDFQDESKLRLDI